MRAILSSGRVMGILSLVAVVALAALACGGCRSEKSAPAKKSEPEKTATATDVLPGLTVMLPEGWTSTAGEGKVTLKIPGSSCHIQIWSMADAKAPADVVAKVPDLVKDEVENFKVDSTKDITIAGSPAKHLIGKGAEADDGDPSNAEVFIFPVGGQVFMVCAHGEGPVAMSHRDDILGVLNTAKP